MSRKPRHRGLVRIFVEQDPDDPLVFLVTDEPGDNAIPVIPTARAHDLWLYSAARDDSRRRHPSMIDTTPEESR